MIWSGAMMLAFLASEAGVAPGYGQAHDAIVTAIEDVLRDGPRTGDLGGKATTVEVGDAIAARVREG
jgi:tartrate dehydrogenase/decarboxylase/D-malate dehydrogenase